MLSTNEQKFSKKNYFFFTTCKKNFPNLNKQKLKHGKADKTKKKLKIKTGKKA